MGNREMQTVATEFAEIDGNKNVHGISWHEPSIFDGLCLTQDGR